MEVHQVMLLTLLFPLKFSVSTSYKECIPRSFGLDSIVCVCNATYCDTISPIEPLPSSQYVVITSNERGLRFRKSTSSFTPTSDNSKCKKCIVINRNENFQSIIGWGGALTDAAGININSLNDGAKQNLLRSYFSNEGIEYTLCRVPMGSTDFSTHAYSYDDRKNDRQLNNFKLAPEDYNYKIPLLKQAGNLSNGSLWLLTSTWTAPKWMKTNHRYDGVGFLKKTMYQVWANYFLKFLQCYKEEGLNFWGITTGNEPSLIFLPLVHVNTVGWLPNEMSSWIANNLGPTLRNSEFSSIKILALDDQRLFLPWFINLIFKSNLTRNYVDGISVHWYEDNKISPTVLTETHEQFPNKFILNAEASIAPVALGCWKYAEHYAHNIIQDLQHWVTGWMDWNIAVDMTGGPSYVNNNHDSPIIVNAAEKEFYKQPMFYALGHFSKFIPRGSVRVNFTQYHGDLSITVFKRPDNGIAVIILNRKNSAVSIIIKDKTRGSIDMAIEPKSLNTILYW